MAKHKKKACDFQKVKLKVGRRLPKGTNIAKMNFKAKKIVLRDQIKQYVGRPGEKQKFDIEELAKGLCFGNAAHKVTNLNKIKGLVSSNADRALLQISNVLRKTAALVVDRNAEVRAAALNVIKEIFSTLSEMQMAPMYDTVRSYIACGATHLQSDVREDALKFLELVVDHFPLAVCDSCKMLNNFLDLISQKNPLGKWSRMLTSNPDERMTAQEWRIKVLQCFLQFLNANITILKQASPNNNPSDIIFDNEQYRMAIVRHGSLEIENMLKFGIKRTEVDRDDRCSSNVNAIWDFLTQFVHLLIDTWKEAALPIQRRGPPFSMTSRESPKVMLVVLQVISSLAEWVTLLTKTNFPAEFLDEFKKKYGPIVQFEFFPLFPLASSAHVTHRSKKAEFRLNLAFCEVFVSVVSGTSSCVSSCRDNVIGFLLRALNMDDYANLPLLIGILKQILLDEKSSDSCMEHLHSVFDTYCNCPSEETRLAAQNLFTDLALDTDYRALCNSKGLNAWLKYLPEELVSMSRINVVDKVYSSMIKKIAGRGYPAFIESLEKNYDSLIEMLEMPENDTQELSAALIAKIQNFTPECFYKLSIAFRNPTVSVSTIGRILPLLSYRVGTEENAKSWREDYLNFLLNVAVGMLHSEQSDFIERESDMYQLILKHLPVAVSSYIIIPYTDWVRHKQITKIIVAALAQLPDRKNVIACIQSFLVLFLSNIEHVPLHAAASILDLHTKFSSRSGSNQNLEVQIANLVLSYYMYEMALAAVVVKREKQMMYSMYKSLIKSRINIAEVLSVIIGNVTAISDYDTAHFMGDLILQVIESTTDSVAIIPGVGMLLTSYLHSMVDRFGSDVQNQSWYKEILMTFPSI